MTEPISAVGVNVLIAREGCKLKAYKDSVGVWTIGVGHVTPPPKVYPGMTITMQEAEAIFQNDLKRYIDAVDNCIKPQMLVNERDSFVSIAFNIGTSGFTKSTFAKRYNAGDKAGCADAIMYWKKPPEIIPRRKAEQSQFLVSYDQSLPKARSTDAKPIPPPKGYDPEAPDEPTTPVEPDELVHPPVHAMEPWEIGALQVRLAWMGYTMVGPADGIWGPKTTAAVAEFQKAVGIETDYGRMTAAALADEANKIKP